MRTRILGASLATLSVVAIFVLRSILVAAPANHHPTAVELLVALVILVAGLPGAGMKIEGPSFFGAGTPGRRERARRP